MTSPVFAGDQPRAACADRIDLVDQTYATGPDALAARDTLTTTLCPTCPIADACLEHAMTRPEAGVWGGVTERARRTILARARHDHDKDTA